MKFAVTVALAIVAATIVGLILPGRDVYHAGWYNAAIVALVVLLIVQSRSIVRAIDVPQARIAALVSIAGVVVLGFAAVVNGLLAPDPQLVAGAPGAQVRVDDLGGTLAFPLAAKDGSLQGDVMLTRAGKGAVALGAWRDVGSFILRRRMRSVVYVEATDSRGAHLTVTQPSGVTFLSPVLLMEQRQAMGGMELPFDSFAIPAAHRIMKAVLFTPQQASQLRDFSGIPGFAVLFAADDDTDRPIAGAIAVARDGQAITLGGVTVRPSVLGYPAIDVVSAPSLLAVIAGLTAAIAGSIAALVLTRRPQRA
jgi:hypothetical protein